MFERDTLIFIAICVALIGIVLAVQMRRNRLVATNALERLLMSSIGKKGVTPEMRDLLSSASLLALEPFESTTSLAEPMTFTASFPKEFANQLPDCDISESGTIQFGPCVIC